MTKMQEPVGVMRLKTLRHLQAAIFHPNPVMNVKLSSSTNCVPPLEGRLGDLQPILPDSLHLLLSLPAFKSAFKPSWHSLQAEYFTLPGPMNILRGNLSHKIKILTLHLLLPTKGNKESRGKWSYYESPNKVPRDYSTTVSGQLNVITQLNNSNAIVPLSRLLSSWRILFKVVW